MNKILEEDINNFYLPEELIANLRDSIMIVTGATGLIGSILVKCLYALKIGIHFKLPIRDLNKATSLFHKELDCITLIQSSLYDFFNDDQLKADYIIH
ncbi:MAG: dTDP-glucose 4,6-dehydratase, partial [Muribaculaceae bacterium]|nr:dTDP-glucose 4,6-dehydratase [Muribaculaceae bacterium]